MSPLLILGCLGLYFSALLGIAAWTGRAATKDAYFRGNQQAPWWLIAFGLIGDSLSGVTFISVPGWVGSQGFSYLQVVLGYAMGYLMIAHVLLPRFYRMNLTSIYGFLGARLGSESQRVGSAFFLLSRLLGSAARLFLAIRVFQSVLFGPLGIPLAVSVTLVIALILTYTLHGGIKTLIWTDAFQSSFLLMAVALSIVAIALQLNLGPFGIIDAIRSSPLTRTFILDWRAPNFLIKQLASGAAIAVVMTGLDQNSMQKNLSCRTQRDAQKNLYAFASVMVLVNAGFLALGALLYHFMAARNLPAPAGSSDQVFPSLALHELGPFAALVFVMGLAAATFNSADSVLTTLTTSFCIDFLNHPTEAAQISSGHVHARRGIHIGFAILLLLTILAFSLMPNTPVIQLVLDLATYTYGPLLGLFCLGLFTRVRLGGWFVPAICIASPLVSLWIKQHSQSWLGGYQIGLELLLINGGLTALGLVVIARRTPTDLPVVHSPTA